MGVLIFLIGCVLTLFFVIIWIIQVFGPLMLIVLIPWAGLVALLIDLEQRS